MKYTKFIIKNYRGIDQVKIDLLNDRVITLVGLNESGKTTIMEACELLQVHPNTLRNWDKRVY